MIRIANLISIFFILLFSCQSWGLVVTPKDIYRYYESQAAIDRSNYDYGAVVKLSGDVVRQTIGALADKAQEGSFYVIGSLHLTSLRKIGGHKIQNRGSGLAIKQIWSVLRAMARPLRLELAGGLYHVTSRGNARNAIYLDDKDRLNWLELLSS